METLKLKIFSWLSAEANGRVAIYAVVVIVVVVAALFSPAWTSKAGESQSKPPVTSDAGSLPHRRK